MLRRQWQVQDDMITKKLRADAASGHAAQTRAPLARPAQAIKSGRGAGTPRKHVEMLKRQNRSLKQVLCTLRGLARQLRAGAAGQDWRDTHKDFRAQDVEARACCPQDDRSRSSKIDWRTQVCVAAEHRSRFSRCSGRSSRCRYRAADCLQTSSCWESVSWSMSALSITINVSSCTQPSQRRSASRRGWRWSRQAFTPYVLRLDQDRKFVRWAASARYLAEADVERSSIWDRPGIEAFSWLLCKHKFLWTGWYNKECNTSLPSPIHGSEIVLHTRQGAAVADPMLQYVSRVNVCSSVPWIPRSQSVLQVSQNHHRVWLHSRVWQNVCTNTDWTLPCCKSISPSSVISTNQSIVLRPSFRALPDWSWQFLISMMDHLAF